MTPRPAQVAGAVERSPVPLRLHYTPIEACVSMVSGFDPFAPVLPSSTGATPRAAAEAVVLEALRRPPCGVSFSGGRDSSAVLALAAHVARREGLPLPIPITLRFPEVPVADESDWQERVLAHAGIDDWVRLEFTDELDLLGPYAERVVARHGLAYPHNLHFHDPMFAQVAGGSLLTGAGGDEMFGTWPRRRARSVVYGRRRPGLGELRPLAAELAPRDVRLRRHRHHNRLEQLTWLRPDARAAVVRLRSEAAVPERLRWDAELARWWRQRYVQCAMSSLRALGGDHDVLVVSPFFEPAFVAAWAAEHGPLDGPGREEGLRGLLGDLLPEDLVARRSKAGFSPAVFGRHSRAFVRAWSGEGLDARLVDPEALRREWIGNGGEEHFPHVSTYVQMRLAWLAERSRPAQARS